MSDANETTYACSITSLIPDERHIQCIRETCNRMHMIALRASELLSLHVIRILNEGRKVPHIDDAFIKMIMMEITHGNGKRTRIDDDVVYTRTSLMADISTISRVNMDQCMMLQSRALASSLQTNLWYHLPKRMLQYVRMCIPSTDVLHGKAYALETLKISSDVLTFPYLFTSTSMTSSTLYHTQILQWRDMFRVNELTGKSWKKNASLHQNVLFHMSYVIHRMFEDNGKSCFSLVPLRRTLTPQFITFDSRAMAHTLGLKCPCEDPHSIWREIINLHPIKCKKGLGFAGSLRTDGVSTRVLFSSTAGQKRGRKRTSQLHMTKTNNIMSPIISTGELKPGLYTIDQLKYESRNAQIIGADPGKRELLVCADIDDGNKKASSVRYTSMQRRHETLVKRHEDNLKKEKTPSILEREAAINFCSRSSSLDKLHGYFMSRETNLQALLEFYSQLHFRQRSWRRYKRRQQSLDRFVNRIKSMQRDPDTPILVGYGSWASVSGRPGQVCNRGMPPCIGVKLRSEISKRVAVVIVPEHRTSMTCSICGDICQRCEEVDTIQRVRRESLATDEVSRTKARCYTVRGLRRCCNVNCSAFLNRDHNAAVNIGQRLKSRLNGDNDDATDEDRMFARFEAALRPCE